MKDVSQNRVFVGILLAQLLLLTGGTCGFFIAGALADGDLDSRLGVVAAGASCAVAGMLGGIALAVFLPKPRLRPALFVCVLAGVVSFAALATYYAEMNSG